MSTRSLFRPVLFASVVGLFAGCASPSSPSAIMDRVDANRAEYETWPLEIKEAVLDGRVVKGMTPAMVRVAKGKPDNIVDRGGGDEVWVYRKPSTDRGSTNSGILSGTSITMGAGSGGTGIYAQPPPIVVGGGSSIGPEPEEDEIVFRDGRVSRAPGVK